MNLNLYIQASEDGQVYDISDIAQEVKVTQSTDGEAGKLTCTLQRDPNNIIQTLMNLGNGSIVSFKCDDQGIFFGYLFKIGTDGNENYQITAYDQMRYLKNTDVYTISGLTASEIFAKICADYGLNRSVIIPSNYKPEPYVYDNKTLYSIIKRGMDLAGLNEGNRYFIVDRFGTLIWSEFTQEKTDVQIGEGSLMTSYTYEKSIDEDTYNQIKFYRDNKDTGKRDVWIVKDSDNIKRWGTLQLLKKADDDTNAAQIRETAQNYLTAKNRQTETLKVEANGVLGLTAGKGIKFVLPRENIDKWMWIKRSTHTFTKYRHTMDLEVEG